LTHCFDGVIFKEFNVCPLVRSCVNDLRPQHIIKKRVIIYSGVSVIVMPQYLTGLRA
jgi:hypothetical protein